MSEQLEKFESTVKCDVCGKGLTVMLEGGITQDTAAVRFTYAIGANAGRETKRYAKKQLGKYKANKAYHVCWECAFKTFGIKP